MNLFVSNISHSIKNEELKSLFEEYGEVTSAKIINDKYSGESKGFGFVDMRDDNQALKAIQKLSNATVWGRKLVVSRAHVRTSKY